MATVVIDCFPESVARYRKGYSVVAVDVIRATTTAISAVAAGRRCFVAPTPEAAHALAAELGNALLVGEQKGLKPAGFDLNNSPAELSLRRDIERPAILVSSSGTRLCHEASGCDAAFLACLRNDLALADYLAGRFADIAVIGAGSRNEFREEDQLCCARIAERLVNLGYLPGDRQTDDLIMRWRDVPPAAITDGNSARYLRTSDQLEDLDFILTHIDDLAAPFALRGSEVVSGGVAAPAELALPAV